ncbi:unnamed protein product [Caenorhabditis auriculariae]|uniref:Abnormal cell migration protein 18-like fibronectin type I domain-containing protein n=1 Tax=Caenorhabditis auriculariae TaxID=2777116 RepID=A0A8S1GYU2_9PELO|nr:unnamed protein product [Caenorhabditis auriculariae]
MDKNGNERHKTAASCYVCTESGFVVVLAGRRPQKSPSKLLKYKSNANSDVAGDYKWLQKTENLILEMIQVFLFLVSVHLAASNAIFDRNFTKPYVLKKTWVQNFIKFQYIFEGKQRKAKIVPLGCVPSNIDDGEMLKVHEQHHGHDFVFSCEEGEDGVLNYEAIACVDAFGTPMYPGEARKLSNGTVILHCNIFGGALKKVVERVAGCYFNETIYGEDEKWIEPLASVQAKDDDGMTMNARLMQCFRPHYSYYESHVVGCVIGRIGVLVGEFGQLRNGDYVKCVESELGSVKIEPASLKDLACSLDNSTKEHNSEWRDDRRAAIMQCNYGHILKTKCLLDGQELPIGQEISVSQGCVFMCHPQTNVYICDTKLDEFHIVDESSNSTDLRAVFPVCWADATLTKHDSDDGPSIISWICPDPILFSFVQSALQQYRTVDDISNYVDQQVRGYKDQMWLVNAINYSRTTADTDPMPNTESQNLCFIQAPSENIIVFIAAINPS